MGMLSTSPRFIARVHMPRGRRLGMVSPLARSVSTWISRAVKPPPTKICASDGGPPVNANRVRLSDGRRLAYHESGVNKADAKYKIVFSHGFTGSRLDSLRASPEVIEELGVYMVGFDRAGYGESDPNPNRDVRTAALDVEELADSLGLGPKFYLVGFSIGNSAVWGALKYIPERLAGAVLMAPVINYRWPGFPPELASEAYNKQDMGDQWALRVAYHAPSILHWWMEQSWLPTSTVIKGTTHLPNKLDAEIHRSRMADGSGEKRKNQATQQGKYESFYREMKVMFGKWDFDPMDLPEPSFPVHLFQGDEDGLVPVTLQRYIADKLSWIKYHELPSTGHYLSSVPGLGDKVLRTVFGNPSSE
ncbi:alpha/beta-Hydrolases superfamily protein [Rhynchospora pubera]|uniref:Alpha/beta-Hydrolases superfamily protein n=1 Tax=Rhynchospora pubera TaxID=906938 RepID=A0AAV8E8M6_9POAL|nr:alpha/beta-Hydrolases superfamily protein [Rhynchospora pubera]